MQQKLFQKYFIARSWKNVEKEPQNPRPKLKKKILINIYRKYLLCLQSNANGSFLQICINFIEQRLEFSHFEGSIIP